MQNLFYIVAKLLLIYCQLHFDKGVWQPMNKSFKIQAIAYILKYIFNL